MKNTISNLKRAPRVNLDCKPLLEEISFSDEFLFLHSASGPEEVRKALWRCPLVRLAVWENIPAHGAQRDRDFHWR